MVLLGVSGVIGLVVSLWLEWLLSSGCRGG